VVEVFGVDDADFVLTEVYLEIGQRPNLGVWGGGGDGIGGVIFGVVDEL
jgi:hypothetical protein